ncbi:unnamed protein product [Rodentolepis nana]|uniref:Uncharacterized protein n=1 Tax=Rodentolepis nana TaxID=102285 RepID=A0A0R3T619_RODNA|nr:unnamed protein product [Rodentolepis nana]
MDECARLHRIPRLSDKRRGFDFGYGSLNDTEYMCRTKYHIKIIQCVKERWEAISDLPAEPGFLKVVLAHTLNTERYERAAAYIFFQQHKNACLQEAEPTAESCSRQTGESIQELVGALKNQSMNDQSDANHRELERIMQVYECKGMRKKLNCLHTLLSSRCSNDAIQLIMNYFIESLPKDCKYQYQIPGPSDSDLITSSGASNPTAMQGDDGTLSRSGQPQPLQLSSPLNYPTDSIPTNLSGQPLSSIMSIIVIPSLIIAMGG